MLAFFSIITNSYSFIKTLQIFNYNLNPILSSNQSQTHMNDKMRLYYDDVCCNNRKNYFKASHVQIIADDEFNKLFFCYDI